ncbi:hypothetical protein C8J56DRAFT_1054064 [Mycena floridula]|nr:hypothetical protein C8J56DRAFT_1054064 [Mycena floridula]
MSDLQYIFDRIPVQQPVAAAMCAALGYGYYSILALAAIYVLIRRRGLHKSLARRVLLGFIITMLLVSTVCFIADVEMSILQDKIVAASAQSSSSALTSWKRCAVMYSISVHVMLFMGDLIVVWRAWVLCERRSIRIPLFCCILASIAGNAIHVAEQIKFWGDAIPAGLPDSPKIITLSALLLLASSNVVATSAIAHKAWMCRVSIRKQLGNISQMTRTEKVLLLLIESGAVYLGGWIVVMILLLLPSTRLAYYYVSEFTPYILAMFPVIVILLVTGRDAPCATAFRDGPPAAPSHPPFMETTPGSSPTPIIHIGFSGASRIAVESNDASSLTV